RSPPAGPAPRPPGIARPRSRAAPAPRNPPEGRDPRRPPPPAVGGGGPGGRGPKGARRNPALRCRRGPPARSGRSRKLGGPRRDPRGPGVRGEGRFFSLMENFWFELERPLGGSYTSPSDSRPRRKARGMSSVGGGFEGWKAARCRRELGLRGPPSPSGSAGAAGVLPAALFFFA